MSYPRQKEVVFFCLFFFVFFVCFFFAFLGNGFVTLFKKFGNQGKFCLWNPGSRALESGIQLKEFGIPLTIGIKNPSSTDQKIRNPEYKAVLDSLTWGEFCLTFWESYLSRSKEA